MNDLRAKVAYLQGLSSGLDLSPDSKEGKLFQGIIGVLDEFAKSVNDLADGQEQIEDYLESIDEDLFHLEDELLGEDDGNYIEVECPRCGETVFFDAHIPEDDDVVEVTCPNCDEVVYVNDESFPTEQEPGTIHEPRAIEEQVTDPEDTLHIQEEDI